MRALEIYARFSPNHASVVLYSSTFMLFCQPGTAVSEISRATRCPNQRGSPGAEVFRAHPEKAFKVAFYTYESHVS